MVPSSQVQILVSADNSAELFCFASMGRDLRFDGRHVLYDPFLRKVQVFVPAHNKLIPSCRLHHLVQHLIPPLLNCVIVAMHKQAVWAIDLLQALGRNDNNVPSLGSWVFQPPAAVRLFIFSAQTSSQGK